MIKEYGDSVGTVAAIRARIRELEERCAGLERELAARDKTIANFDFDIVPKLDARIRTLEAALRKIVTMDPCVDWCHFDGDEEEGTDILSIARAALAPTATEGRRESVQI